MNVTVLKRKGMSLGLHSLLFPTKVKVTTADMTCNLALFASDSRTLTNRLGGSSCSAALLILAGMFLSTSLFALNIDFGPNGCTLQDAIRSANNDSAVGNCAAGSGHDVLISPDVWKITLNSRLPTITTDVTITTTTPSGRLTISGDNDHAVMKITGADTDVTLQRVLITEASSFTIRGAGLKIEDANVHLIDSSFTFNRSTARYGGAIYIENGELEITRGYLAYNSILNNDPPKSGGGAVSAFDSDVVINETTFSDNYAKSDLRDLGGLDYFSMGYGASIYMDGGTLEVNQSTFDEEIPVICCDGSISAVHGKGSVATFINSSFHRQTPAGYEDTNGLLYFEEASALTLNHVTIRGSLKTEDTILNMTNSILRGECNIEASTSWIIDAGNLYNTPNFLCPDTGNVFYYPMLLDLQNNGGLTSTFALERLSDAINAGDPNYCTSTDQRGIARDSHCDIGAYEVNEFADVGVAGQIETNEPYVHQQVIEFEAVITNNSTAPVNEVRIDMSLDNAFITEIDSGLCASFPCTLVGIQGLQQITIPMTMSLSSFEDDFSIELTANQTINSTYDDTNAANDISTINKNIIDGADLEVVMDLTTRGNHFIGQVIEYQADINNLGFDSVNDASFEFTSEGLNLISMTGCESVVGSTCELGLLNNGSRRTVDIQASISAAEFDAVATVTSSLHDINPINNIDQLGNNGALGETDLTITVYPVNNGPYYSYEYVPFEVKVATGNDPASNILMWMDFPGAEFIGCSGSMNLDGYCELGSLAANSVMLATVDYFAPITSGDQQELFPLTISVNPGEVDLNIDDNTFVYDLPVDANSDIVAQLELLTPPPYTQTQEIIFNLRVVNGGLNHASDVLIDLDPDNLTLQWQSASLCQSIPCNIHQLNRFDEENLTLAYRIDDAGDFSLLATAVANQVDLNPNNNAETVANTAQSLPSDVIFKDSFD